MGGYRYPADVNSSYIHVRDEELPYLKLATYQEREREWRERAATLEPGAERDACIALADGYRDLVSLIERVESNGGKRQS